MQAMMKWGLSLGLALVGAMSMNSAQAQVDSSHSANQYGASENLQKHGRGYASGYGSGYGQGHGSGYGNGYGGSYGQGYGYDDTTVRCESRDGRYRECFINAYGGVQILRQLSRTQCIEGRNWGFSGNSIWVDRGCRAEFSSHGGGHRNDYGRGYGYGQGGYNQGSRGGYGHQSGYGNGYYPGHSYNGFNGGGLICESISNRYNHCAVSLNRARVFLDQQLSHSACILGRTWGYDRGGIWVDRGCRAQFSIR